MTSVTSLVWSSSSLLVSSSRCSSVMMVRGSRAAESRDMGSLERHLVCEWRLWERLVRLDNTTISSWRPVHVAARAVNIGETEAQGWALSPMVLWGDNLVSVTSKVLIYLKLGQLRQKSLVQMRDSLARSIHIAKDLIEVAEELPTVGDAPSQLNVYFRMSFKSKWFPKNLIDVF